MRRLAILLIAVLALACRVEFGEREGVTASKSTTVTIYSSIYKDVIDAIKPVLAERLAQTSPGTTVEWFQSGSEKVAQRLDAEFAAGSSAADILLASDPGYYARLKAEGRLVPYVSPAALRQPRALVDPDGAFAAARISTMVIGISPALAAKPAKDQPARFADLTTPGFRATMGDPLTSGTFFTTVSVLSSRLGWEWFEKLKGKGTIANGGNAKIIERLDNGEADAGMVLLENLLTVRARGGKAVLVVPADGPVAIPGSIALLPHARHSEAARAVYDAILSAPVQKVIVEKGNMHSPDPAVPPPAGAPSLELVLAGYPEKAGTAEEVKTNFYRIFFQ